MKKICFVTLSRSDYTSLKPVIKAAQGDPDIDVNVVAGGSHLLKRFGQSIGNIKKDGIKIHSIADFFKDDDDSDLDMARAFARATPLFVEEFESTKPDAVFVLGDRWEMLAVATAASFLRIPIVHHSGGDITQGSLDNQTRYALTVFSHVHLVALDEHKERLLKMGEEKWRVETVGEPALTEIQNIAKSIPDIYSELGLSKKTPFVLATFHPTTFDEKPLVEQVEVFIKALDLIEEEIILTAPNPDPGSGAFLAVLHEYANRNPKVHLFNNLGAQKYYASMDKAEFMIGNSSSGIWEAPSFSLPVINIGQRQADRLRGNNVIDTPLEVSSIASAIEKVKDVQFQEQLEGEKNPYVQPDTNQLILNSLKSLPNREKLLSKIFVDPLSMITTGEISG